MHEKTAEAFPAQSTRTLAVLMLAFLAALPISAQSESTAEKPGPLRIHREAGELAIPAAFKLADQRLEVFGCHESGPTHETVVTFRAKGAELYAALVELGFRPPAFWNATGEDELRRTLGDRALISLRWVWKGKSHELPAERLFRDAESSFQPFIRGFSFSLEPQLLGDPPERRVPGAVEITLGDPTRRESLSSAFFHPRDLEALTRWVGPIRVDPGVVADAADMLSREISCELVIRRVAGEVELLGLRRSLETDPARLEFLDSLESHAREIDRLKALYVARVTRIESLLETLEKNAQPGKEETRSTTAALAREVAGGRLEAARIHDSYLAIFEAEERFRVEWVEAQAGLSEETGVRARSRFALGFIHERQLSRIAVRLARLEAAREGGPENSQDSLLRQAFELEREIVFYTRESQLARSVAEWEEKRLADPELEDRELVEPAIREEILRASGAALQADYKVMELGTQVSEKRARAGGTWQESAAKVLLERDKAQKGLALARLKLERVDVLSDIRWTRYSLEDTTKPEKVADLEKKLTELSAKKGELEKKIERTEAELR